MFETKHPLGLPKGSVRATITLALSIDLVWLSIEKEPVANQLATLTAIALTFYFGGKMRAEIPIPKSVTASERAWGLPAGTIRFLIILIFGFGVYQLLIVEGESFLPSYYLEVIYSVIGYNLGMIYMRIRKRLFPNPKTSAGFLDHLKSLAFLVLTGITIYYTIYHSTSPDTENLIFGSTVLLGFYFGVRDQKQPTGSGESQ
ncbi:MAG: hypothetical protein HeimC2_42970 [Candidatus Heimdallarchaeota archaeon LC_2]|nr:MAG: hypothetical protein HeimC2_42970 [Candidatus Heimdallarchaeota archaeon LC_2]